MGKPKVASDWMAGCAGCHMSLLDMDERIVANRRVGGHSRHPHHRLERAG
jgi:coenzyme F420-reducing hydrogenase gamma subunit